MVRQVTWVSLHPNSLTGAAEISKTTGSDANAELVPLLVLQLHLPTQSIAINANSASPISGRLGDPCQLSGIILLNPFALPLPLQARFVALA
jgi:hypothetical protein